MSRSTAVRVDVDLGRSIPRGSERPVACFHSIFLRLGVWPVGSVVVASSFARSKDGGDGDGGGGGDLLRRAEEGRDDDDDDLGGKDGSFDSLFRATLLRSYFESYSSPFPPFLLLVRK